LYRFVSTRLGESPLPALMVVISWILSHGNAISCEKGY
jgi:hypothetical protein